MEQYARLNGGGSDQLFDRGTVVEHRDRAVQLVDEDRVRVDTRHVVHRGEEVLGVRGPIDEIAADRIAAADHLS